ncbi:MAG: hydrogenase [Chloroflexota bacterium]|nr:MAG: hydrogenase [Chloroflexota bacterium]
MTTETHECTCASRANPFMPYLAKIRSIEDLTYDVKLFNLELLDPEIREKFEYGVGQFGFVSVFGIGEAPFDISSLGHRKAGIEFAIRRVGTVSRGMHELQVDDVVGVRGPFGNTFPMHEYKGKDLVIIGGGIGMAPMRSVINYIMDFRDDYGDVFILNGARSPQDLVFKPEFEIWQSSPRTRLELTVDRGDESWKGRVDLIPTVVAEVKPSPKNAVAIICGPPIMIKFTLQQLKKLEFGDDQIVTTLESKMKCGIGKCGRCNVGEHYVCLEGPVFTMAQINQFLEEF